MRSRRSIDAKELTITLLLTIIIVRSSAQGYGGVEYSIEDFQRVIPDMEEITSTSIYRNELNNQKGIFTIFYRTSANEHKITILKIGRLQGIQAADKLGNVIQNPIIKPAQETHRSMNCVNSNPAYNENALYVSLNKLTRTIKAYDNDLEEISHQDLVNIPHTQHDVNFTGCFNFGNGDMAVLVATENTLMRARFDLVASTVVIGYYSHVFDFAGIEDITFNWINSIQFIFFKKSTGHEGFTFSGYQLGGAFTKVVDDETGLDFQCKIFKPNFQARFLCLNDGDELKFYRFDNVNKDRFFLELSLDSTRMVRYDIADTVFVDSPYFDDTSSFLVMGERDDGVSGVAFVRRDNIELINFIPIEIEGHSRLIANQGFSYFFGSGSGDKVVKVYSFRDYTGIENCLVNEEPEAFMSMKCAECLEGYSLGPDGLCYESCQEYERMENGACVSCRETDLCNRCDMFALECYECLQWNEPNLPYEQGKPLCKEIEPEDTLKFIHVESSITISSDLAFEVYVTYSNGTEFEKSNFLINSDGEQEPREIFRVTDAKNDQVQNSTTHYYPNQGLYTLVNLTQELKEANGPLEIKIENIQPRLNLNYSLKKNSQIFRISINPGSDTNLVNYQNTLSTLMSDSKEKEGAISLAILLDPTSITLKASHFIRFSNKFAFINIDFGKKLTTFLERAAAVEQDETNQLRILEQNKGKFTLYKIESRIQGNLLIKLMVYICSWLLNLVQLLLKRRISGKGQASKFENFSLLFCWKLKFIAFTLCSIDIIFYGSIVISHKEITSFWVFSEKLLIQFCFFLIIVDLLAIYLNARLVIRNLYNDHKKRKENQEIPKKKKISEIFKKKNKKSTILIF